MAKIFSLLAGLHHKLTGNKQLLPREQVCLDAWKETLAKEQRAILDAQLGAINFVQRQAGGAKVCFYFHHENKKTNSAAPLFDNRLPDQHVADVILKSSRELSAHAMRVKVFLHRGLFFSIEFPKRPERYMQLHSMREASLYVEGVNKISAV